MNEDLSRIWACAVLASYFYVLSEWIFFYTTPSFLDNFDPTQNLATLFVVPLFLITLSLLPLLASGLMILLVPNIRGKQILRWVSLLVPAIIMGETLFLLFENFTYTLFKFNVGTFSGAGRFVYAAGFVALVVWMCRETDHWIRSPFWDRQRRRIFALIVILLSISLLLAAIAYSPPQDLAGPGAKKSVRRPNILILSTDGLNANHTSVYGYARETTPFIKQFATGSLLFENFFTNCANSAGSIGALLTGKLPTTTRVIFSTDVFHGTDEYQHLPGILKKMGYRSAEISLRHYTDPLDLNLRDGFDLSNDRRVDRIAEVIRLPAYIQRAFSSQTYFLEQTSERLTERLAHAFGIRDMINPYLAVTQAQGANPQYTDSERVAQIRDFIDASREPFFIHVHFMGTHGARFDPPTVQVFSAGEVQDHDWMVDFFDDTVLDYDRYVKQVVQHLKDTGRFESTIVILTTDHGMNWHTYDRLPLIIRFPHQEYKGKVSGNVQAIDIAPTILAYMGATIPDWMEGSPLLPPLEMSKFRVIVSARTGKWGSVVNGWQHPAKPEPPFYSMGGLALVVCNRWYQLDLTSGELQEKDIDGHTRPCTEQELPTPSAVLQYLLSHLVKKGYDVSSVPVIRRNAPQ